MELTGNNLIAGEESSEGTDIYRSVSPTDGAEFGPDFHDATEDEVLRAVAAAEDAFLELRAAGPGRIAGLLEDIAARLEEAGEEILRTADAETGLGETRLTGELARTCAQLRAFAGVVSEGSHLDVRIDRADPGAVPPRPDLRRIQVPVGPVAVFGASNFPLAFSVPGGDTASALAGRRAGRRR